MTFRLTTLLYLFAIVASSIAVLGAWGALVGFYIFAAWLWLRRERYWLSTWRGKGEFLFLFVILPALIYPIYSAFNPRREGDGLYNPGIHHQKVLALAIQQYYGKHGHFPPPYVTDDNGTPLYSWRVLLLPYIEQPQIAEQFHYGEPWDSPHNRQLLSDIEFFQSRGPTVIGETQFLAVVGDDTLWNPDREITDEDVTDGLDKTLLIVEVPSRGIHWSEPRDLSRDEAIKLLKSSERKGYMAFADGSVHAIPRELEEHDASALLTIAGGEPIPSLDQEDAWEWSNYRREGTPLAIPFWIAIVLLPLVSRLGIFPRRDEANPTP